MREPFRLRPPVVDRIATHAAAEHPKEACGFVYASGRYRVGKNVQDSLHAHDPARFQRTATTAFSFSAGDLLKLADSLDGDDPVVAIVHSHPGGVGAYFSETDREAALIDGRPAYDVDQVVVAVDRAGRATDIAHFVWQGGNGYVEVDHFPIGGNGLPRSGSTPLLEMVALMEGTASRVFLKYEPALVTGSHKERAARMALLHAEVTAELPPHASVRLIAPTGGNYGAALVRIAAERGHRVTAVVPDNYPLGKIRLLQALGADVVLADHTLGNNAHGRLAMELFWERPSGSLLVDQFNDVANVWGHYATGHEIVAQLGSRHVDYLVAGIGSGAHLTGIGRVLRRRWPDIGIVGVQPAGCDILTGVFPTHGIPGLAVGLCPPILDVPLITRMEAVDYDDAVGMLRKVVSSEGVSMGLSSAANLVVSLRLAYEADRPVNIVTIAYDKVDSYLDAL